MKINSTLGSAVFGAIAALITLPAHAATIGFSSLTGQGIISPFSGTVLT